MDILFSFNDSIVQRNVEKHRKREGVHTFQRLQDTVDTIYRIILSVNQLSVYGAVAAICEEFEDHQDRTGQPVILVGQSIVLGDVKAEVTVHDEDPRNDQIIWQQYIQQVESLSPENKLSKFCKEAGFMRVVEVGQYFVTKDTGAFRQFQSVACREYTLPRDDQASQPKGWIQGNMRICWCLQYTQPLTSHSPPVSPMVTTTTTKSWRSDTLIILPGWECHTGGSRSKPTVHRCSQSGRRLWVARQVTTTSPMAQPQCSKKECINVNMVAEQSRSTVQIHSTMSQIHSTLDRAVRSVGAVSLG